MTVCFCHTPHVDDDGRWDETWHRLLEWTDSRGKSERLAAQVLSDQGFTDVDPRHPLGGRDRTADALARRDGKLWVMAVYFARGQQDFSEVKKKFLADHKGVAANQAEAFVFVTNQELRVAQREDLQKSVQCPVELFHLERVVAVLDQPRMEAVRRQFLRIGLPKGVLDRSERIEELRRASVARCAARWAAVGLPPNEALALALAEDTSVGAVDPSLCPCSEKRLVVWTAPMGSGKSIASERHHQICLEAAADDGDAPVPVFLRASECIPTLAAAVETAAQEVGPVRTVGAAVVVDGMDEVGYQVAEELLTQARVLVGTWPASTVLLTSRGVPVLSEAPENKAFPPLEEAEQRDCVKIGLGDRSADVRLHSLPVPVRATLGQPFFALLVGLWMRDRGGVPRAPIDLLAMLGERATRGLKLDQSHLRALAVRAVAREFGPVAAGDVLQGARADDLLATGMLERRGGSLAFVLPAVAQWFAAQVLLLAEVSVEQLLAAPEDLELWRYPLALAISLGSAEQARSLLGPMLASDTGFAMRVLDTTFGHAVLGGATPPPWREGGTLAREALQALADALGPLAPFVCKVDAAGHVLPMAVSSGEHHLHVSFWKGTARRPDIFPMTAGMDPWRPGSGWVASRSSQVGPGSAWAWHWASQGVHTALDRALQHRALPVSVQGPLGREAAWAAACDLVGVGPLLTGEIELSRLVGVMGGVPEEEWKEGPVLYRKGRTTYDLRGLHLLVGEARARGESHLVAPIPPADKLPAPDGRLAAGVGAFYTDDRLMLVAKAIYGAAIIGYRELVERWMPRLLPQLEHHVLMPMRIVGVVNRGGGHGIGIPSLAGYVEALPPGVEDEVVMDLSDQPYDFSAGDSSYARQRAARPSASRWITGTHGGMLFEIGRPFPVSEVVYRWLVADLERLGMASPASHTRSGDAIVPFDV